MRKVRQLPEEFSFSCVSSGSEGAKRTYSSKRLQREIIRHIYRIHNHCSIRLERKTPCEPDRCGIRERDMREEEERRPEDDGDADEMDGDVYRMGVVACVECEL